MAALADGAPLPLADGLALLLLVPEGEAEAEGVGLAPPAAGALVVMSLCWLEVSAAKAAAAMARRTAMNFIFVVLRGFWGGSVSGR